MKCRCVILSSSVSPGLDPSWYLQHVIVWDRQTDNMYFFLVDDWLSVENEKNEGLVEKEVLAACECYPMGQPKASLSIITVVAPRGPHPGQELLCYVLHKHTVHDTSWPEDLTL